MTKKVIVVGSGFGGLASALRLKSKEIFLIWLIIISHIKKISNLPKKYINFIQISHVISFWGVLPYSVKKFLFEIENAQLKLRGKCAA